MDALTTYLLLDGAQIDKPLPCIYSMQSDATVHLLYQRTAYAEWAEHGPCLVRTVPDGPLMQHFETHWRGRAGLLLASNAELDDLLDHLRSLVHARVDGEQVVLFRYYDPRILPLWLESLMTEERDLYLGPVQQIYLPTAEGQDLLIQRGDQPAELKRYTDEPWLRLNAEQLDTLSGAKQTLFEERLLEHLLSHFPDDLAHLDDAQRRQLVRRARDSAAQHGYSSADEVARWSSLLLICGSDFPQAPEHARYRELLAQPGRLPAERLDDLLHAAAHQDKESAV